MQNPVLIELTRGRLGESTHSGAVAVVSLDGDVVAGVGDTARPVFPRSAIKPLQAFPFLETGAVDRFGFGEAEIAIACASHTGTSRHTKLVAAMLQRAGLSAEALGCGTHEPTHPATQRALIRSGAHASPLHHNCSGKHAAMLATAVHKAEPTEGYWRPDHPVQQRIRRALEDMTGATLGADVCGIDGCSVPNWAIPLAGLAHAFARLGSGAGLAAQHAATATRITGACWAHPDLVAGPDALVTEVMLRLRGQVLVKSGAEGVYCGALPEHALGFALKIDDGAKRASEVALAAILRYLEVLDDADWDALAEFTNPRILNRAGREVGEIRTVAGWPHGHPRTAEPAAAAEA
jgi:L-asparaginase II